MEIWSEIKLLMWICALSYVSLLQLVPPSSSKDRVEMQSLSLPLLPLLPPLLQMGVWGIEVLLSFGSFSFSVTVTSSGSLHLCPVHWLKYIGLLFSFFLFSFSFLFSFFFFLFFSFFLNNRRTKPVKGNK